MLPGVPVYVFFENRPSQAADYKKSVSTVPETKTPPETASTIFKSYSRPMGGETGPEPRFLSDSAYSDNYSVVTDFAKLRGLSTSVPRARAVWYANNCSGTTWSTGDRSP